MTATMLRAPYLTATTVLSLTIASTALAQQGSGATDLAASVDSVFAQFAKPDTPGCAVSVVHNRRLVYARGFGSADLEHGVQITPRTVFNVGSIAKQFTAASVLLLASGGRLSLDDDVRRHIPEMSEHVRPITVRHLLHHTSGLRDPEQLLMWAGMRPGDAYLQRDAFAIVTRQKDLNFPPGDRWEYSNAGYVLLATVVERVSGKPLREFARDAIFAPLGMHDTRFHTTTSDIIRNRARGYSPAQSSTFRLNVVTGDYVGDGGLYSTVEDLALWAAALQGGGIGDGRIVARMEEPVVLSNGRRVAWGAGVRLGRYRDMQWIGHSGSDAGYRSAFYRVPESGHSFTVLCNNGAANASQLTRRIADLYLPSTESPRVPSLGRGKWPYSTRQFSGVYWSERAGSLLHLTARGDTLLVHEGEGWTPLERTSAWEFERADVSRVRFTPPASDSAPIGELELAMFGSTPVVHSRVREWRSAAAELSTYAGDYGSSELGVTWTLLQQDGRLVLRRRGFTDVVVEPLFRDAVGTGSLWLRFVRDRSARVVAFRANSPRARHVMFVKRAAEQSTSPRADSGEGMR